VGSKSTTQSQIATLRKSNCFTVSGIAALAPNEIRTVTTSVEAIKNAEDKVNGLQPLAEAECRVEYQIFPGKGLTSGFSSKINRRQNIRDSSKSVSPDLL
jgi:hypothetical protein